MAVIGGDFGYHLLTRLAGSEIEALPRNSGSAYSTQSKLEVLLGKELWPLIEGKTVIDFGCGTGEDAIELARRGAARVMGVDIQERYLVRAREAAREAGVAERCEFAPEPAEPADLIIAIDSFEHFEDPAGILRTMRRMIKPDGLVLISFGPTWYHPYGGHLFSVFPWAHLLFTERALIRWRSTFKSDGATRFCEVEGGLNQMSIRRFRRLVAESPFRFVHFEPQPIRKLRWLANPLTREFTTSLVRCKLAPLPLAA